MVAARLDAQQRQKMLKVIRQHSRSFAGVDKPTVIDPRVLQVMGDIPRHAFVPEPNAARAYTDQPLTIGYGQTISQPFIVALMTSLAQIEPHHRVLEVGTGSGYQTAVLSRLAAEVFTIEVVAPLAQRAQATLKAHGIQNVTAEIGDGHHGLPRHGPFDAIVVTAAPAALPEALVAQLKPGGRLVIPVGTGEQELHVIERHVDGDVGDRTVVAVRFVPLING